MTESTTGSAATATPAPLDGATVEVIRNYVVSVAEQMRRTLVRAAFNPVIYDVLDFGISMYDSGLSLMAESAGITHFLGANDHAIVKGTEYIGIANMSEGDVYLLNYPYWSGAHAYDAMLFAPVFQPGRAEPSAYLAVRAHWMDLGAKDPGYVLDSTDMHQEGLIFPGTKIVSGGEITRDVIELIRFNSRLPDLTIGDFHAQLAALRTGEARLKQVWDKFGAETVEQAVRQVIEHGERVARRAVAALPDGSWTAVDWCDDDNVTDDLIRMQVTVTIKGDEMIADFNGSSSAVAGPVNLPIGATQGIAKSTFKSLTTPGEATNAGHFRPLTVAGPGHRVHPGLLRRRRARLHGRRVRPPQAGLVRGQQQRGHRLGRDQGPRRRQRPAAPVPDHGAEHPSRGAGAQGAAAAQPARADPRLRRGRPAPRRGRRPARGDLPGPGRSPFHEEEEQDPALGHARRPGTGAQRHGHLARHRAGHPRRHVPGDAGRGRPLHQHHRGRRRVRRPAHP
jgi:hypothetical protein